MLILWDIDGTLLRTTHGVGREMYIRAFRSVFSIDVTPSVSSMSFAGRTDRSLVHELGASVGLTASEVEVAWPQIELDMIASAKELIRPDTTVLLEGARETLDLLIESRISNVLVTGNIESIGHHKLSMAGLAGYFTLGAFGGDHADRRHLPPLAIEKFNVEHTTTYRPHHCIVIGDAVGDVECAATHGIASLCVTTGVQSADTLRQAGATHVVDSLHPPERTLSVIRELLAQRS